MRNDLTKRSRAERMVVYGLLYGASLWRALRQPPVQEAVDDEGCGAVYAAIMFRPGKGEFA